MGKLVDITNPKKPRILSKKAHYAVYIDEDANCLAVEDLDEIDREIVAEVVKSRAPLPPRGKKPAPVEIIVMARKLPDLEYKIYKKCYDFGVCYDC